MDDAHLQAAADKATSGQAEPSAGATEAAGASRPAPTSSAEGQERQQAASVTGTPAEEMQSTASGQVAQAGRQAAPFATGTASGEGGAGAKGDGARMDVILHIPVTVQVVLGRTRMPISRLMSLGPGAVVPLDRKAGDPVEVLVNGRLVARGEVVLLDDNVRFGVSLTEIIEPGISTC